MKPKVKLIDISAPYPWRDFRLPEYAPRVEGDTFILKQCHEHGSENGAPRLESSLREVADGLVEITIYSPRVEGFQGIFTHHFYVWDGAQWVRHRRDHRDVRMRMTKAATRGKD